MSALTVNTTTFGNFLGTIGGAGTNENNLSLAVQGGGVLTLDGSGGTGSTFTGKTTVTGGSIVGIRVGNELGAPSSLVPDAITLNNGVLMNMTNATSTTVFGLGWSPTLGANVGITLGALGGTLRAGYVAKTFTINGPITGAGPLTAADGSVISLNGVNTYAGNTTINGGSNLQIGGAGQLGSGAYAGAIANAGTFTYSSSAAQTISGAISGAGALVEAGPGKMILTNTGNNYSGGTTVSGGTLQIGDGLTSNGSLPGNASVSSGGTLAFNYVAGTTYNGVISGAGGIYVTGVAGGNNTGKWLTLGGANTYSGGTVVQNGVLQITSDANLGTAPATAAVNIVLDAGELFNNSSSPTLSLTRTIQLNAGGGFIRSGYAPNRAFTINGQITGVGGFGLSWDGQAVVLGSNANNYQGNTTIGLNGPDYFGPGSALLQLSIDSGLPFGPNTGNLVFGVNPTLNSAAATLDLNGHSAQVNGLIAPNDSTANAIVDSSTAGTFSFTVGNNNAAGSYSGKIQNTAGTLSLVKVGSGVQTLTNNLTYSGSTTVSGGTLRLTNASSTNSIANSHSISVGSGATLDVSGLSGGTIALGGSTTLSGSGTVNGSITTASGTIINPGSPSAIGTLQVNNNLSLASGVNLNYVLGTAARVRRVSARAV